MDGYKHLEDPDWLREHQLATGGDLNKLVVVLWSKAVGTKGYSKRQWALLQQSIHTLQNLTPPPTVEPEPWSGNGIGP